MKNLFLTAALISLLFMFSCGDDDSSGPTKESEIMPLSMGNYWKYEVTDGDTSAFMRSVIGDTTIEGEQWFIIKSSSEGSDDYSTSLYKNKENGLYAISYSEENGFSETLLFKYPCKTGDAYGFGEEKMHVFATDVEVSVNGEKHSCIHYRTTLSILSSKTELNFYLKPGIGIIKLTSNEFDYDYKSKDELIDYNIN